MYNMSSYKLTLLFVNIVQCMVHVLYLVLIYSQHGYYSQLSLLFLYNCGYNHSLDIRHRHFLIWQPHNPTVDANIFAIVGSRVQRLVHKQEKSFFECCTSKDVRDTTMRRMMQGPPGLHHQHHDCHLAMIQFMNSSYSDPLLKTSSYQCGNSNLGYI